MNYNQPATLQAAILDWAGTVVDSAAFALTQIFVEAFAEFGVQVSLEKRAVRWEWASGTTSAPSLRHPGDRRRYRAVFGRLPSDGRCHRHLRALHAAADRKIAEHSALIPGARRRSRNSSRGWA